MRPFSFKLFDLFRRQSFQLVTDTKFSKSLSLNLSRLILPARWSCHNCARKPTVSGLNLMSLGDGVADCGRSEAGDDFSSAVDGSGGPS